MALIVKVFVNERQIADEHVVRIKGKPGEICTYETGEGEIIHHDYDDGFEPLVIKMMKVRLERGYGLD